ncbi:hypothetical protein CERSUDRAFT_77384 [Gelatoporia subvermispora B]|uniref:Uncharacterized protein n=1 Tax=Ceriporiopsis subvermispora (strain B) TaxID=914234 RepID=M2PA51_CERS8|nr:hypothetical protein CERSUDRAFT_77384 [Gelatoporia subvermispora B]
MCTGKNDPDHAGYWYSKCLNNKPPSHNTCSHFAWDESIPQGRHSSRPSLCPGHFCKSGRRASVNQECTFGLCKECCGITHWYLPEIRSCDVSKHRPSTGFVPPVVVVPAPPAQAQPPFDEGTAIAPFNHQSAASTTHSGQINNQSARLGNTHRTYRHSISPLYQQTRLELEREERERVEDGAVSAQYAREQKKVITVFWWPKDDNDLEIYEVVAPDYPWFHPQQSHDLVEQYHVDKTTFQYFDWKRQTWINGSPRSPAQNVRISEVQELHYRSAGVRDAPGMPGRSLKRSASAAGLLGDGDSPFKQPLVSMASSSTHAEHHHSDLLSPLPAPSSSSLFSISSPISTLSTWAPPCTPPKMSSYVSQSQMVRDCIQREKTSVASEFLDLTPSGALASPTITTGSLDSLDMTFTSSREASVSLGWPLKYVIDMAEGFQNIQRLESQGIARQRAFEMVYDTSDFKYKKSTYSDNHRAWAAAANVEGERELWYSYGRTANGEWLRFMKKWRQGTRRNSLSRAYLLVTLVRMAEATLLTMEDIEHLPGDELKAILRAWLSKKRLAGPSFQFQHAKFIAQRIIEEKAAVDWAAVASGTAHTPPDPQDDSPEAKELHRAIAMEKTLRDLLLQKLIDIPQQEESREKTPERAITSPLSSPPTKNDQTAQNSDASPQIPTQPIETSTTGVHPNPPTETSTSPISNQTQGLLSDRSKEVYQKSQPPIRPAHNPSSAHENNEPDDNLFGEHEERQDAEHESTSPQPMEPRTQHFYGPLLHIRIEAEIPVDDDEATVYAADSIEIAKALRKERAFASGDLALSAVVPVPVPDDHNHTKPHLYLFAIISADSEFVWTDLRYGVNLGVQRMTDTFLLHTRYCVEIVAESTVSSPFYSLTSDTSPAPEKRAASQSPPRDTPKPSKRIRKTEDQAEIDTAVVDWLTNVVESRDTFADYKHALEHVRTTHKKNGSVALSLLMDIVHGVARLLDLKKTDGEAAAIARYRPVTRTAIGLFLKRQPAWVSDCVTISQLLDAHDETTQLDKLIREWENVPLGVTALKLKMQRLEEASPRLHKLR